MRHCLSRLRLSVLLWARVRMDALMAPTLQPLILRPASGASPASSFSAPASQRRLSKGCQAGDAAYEPVGSVHFQKIKSGVGLRRWWMELGLLLLLAL